MSNLPNELIIVVAEFLVKTADINALAQVNSRFYHLLNGYLYRHNSKYNGGSALVWATKRNNISTARKAVQAGARADETLVNFVPGQHFVLSAMYFPVWVAPLALAMKLRRKEIVQLLLAQDIDFTKPHSTSHITRSRMLLEYVLCKAVDDGDLALFHELLDRGSDILLRQASWCTSQVIHHIVKAKKVPQLEAFLDRGFSLSGSQSESKMLLFEADDKAMLEFLLDHVFDCSLYPDEALQLLRTGMCRGSPAAIDYALDQYGSYDLISEGPLLFKDIEQRLASQDMEWKLLWYGCDEDDMQRTVQHLIDRGADPNPQTSQWAHDTLTDVLFYRHETVMQTIVQGCYARGVTTAELKKGISSCPDIYTQPICSEIFSKWWQKYLVT